MAKDTQDEQIVMIKKAIDEGKLIIGFKETMQALRHKEVATVIAARNVEEGRMADLKDLAAVSEVELVVLTQANDELGVICKKPFSISVLAIKNE